MMDPQSADAAYAELERQALLFESQQRLVQARDAFDAALQLNPSSQACAEGRARVALALTEPEAVRHCQRALAYHQDHPERQLRMISTVASELGTGAIPLFEDFVARHPRNAKAHELLSSLRAEDGAGDRFLDSFVNALRTHPEDRQLRLSYWDMMARARKERDALHLMMADEAMFAGDRRFAMLAVQIANHAGFVDIASRLLPHLDDSPEAQLQRGQHHLLLGRPNEAAEILESVVSVDPGNLSAWSLLELCWRSIGDRRHEWLIGQPGLYGAYELDLSSSQLATIAARLRTLHVASSQPVGQSVRGGTQTPGQLFTRQEPEIAVLTAALAETIRGFVEHLPPYDPGHPLLKHRNDGMAFGPSWSVRLSGNGHHAAHFHPGGILSSACYISLPDTLSDRVEQPGWLELGRPPPALGLDLPPLATFQPIEGRLVMFPSFLFHGTRPFPDGERLTVAFDLVAVAPD